jgi:hypothetical protein
MISEPKKKTKIIFSYLTLIYVGIFVSVIAFITYLEIKFTNDSPNVVSIDVPEVKVLTSEEVAKEKLKFISISQSPNLVSEEIDNTSKNNFIINDEQQNYYDNSITRESAPSSYLINTEAGEREIVVTSTTTNFEYVRTDSKISVQTTYDGSDIESQKTPFILDGSIYAKNDITKEIVITLSDGSGFGKIRVSPQTYIKINGKDMSFLDLKTADKVRVEGQGNITSKEMLADIITYNGSVQLIPIN